LYIDRFVAMHNFEKIEIMILLITCKERLGQYNLIILELF